MFNLILLSIFALININEILALQYFDLQVPNRNEGVCWKVSTLLSDSHLEPMSLALSERNGNMRYLELDQDFGYSLNVFSGFELDPDIVRSDVAPVDLAHLRVFVMAQSKLRSLKARLPALQDNSNIDRLIFRNSLAELRCRDSDRIDLSQEAHATYLNICAKNGIDGLYNINKKKIATKWSRRGFGVVLSVQQMERKVIFIPNWRFRRPSGRSSSDSKWLLEIEENTLETAETSRPGASIIIEELVPRGLIMDAEHRRSEEDTDSYMHLADTSLSDAEIDNCPICLDGIDEDEQKFQMKNCPQYGQMFHLECLQRAYTSTGRCPVCNVSHSPSE